MKRTLLFIFVFMITLGAVAQQSAYRKMSPLVRMASDFGRNGNVRNVNKAKPENREHPRSLCAFVQINGNADAVFSRYGCRRLATFGDIYIADIPLANLNAMACEQSVMRIEASPSRTELLERSAKVVGADKVHAGTSLPQAFTGNGVVTGIVDIGFDLTNPNFYNRDLSRYRIMQFWDMLSTDTVGSNMYVGAEYTTKDDILAYAHSRDGLVMSHGAYTLGVLSGTGFGTPYRGMAYESDIVAVSNAVTSDTIYIKEEDLYKFTSATDALGFKYAFDYAESHGMPCVVSFSEGSHQTLDSDELLNYEVLRQMTGPGRIIVASAGNEGHYRTYIHKPVGTEGVGTYIQGNGKTVSFRASTDGDFTVRFNAYDSQRNAETIDYKFSDVLADADSLVYDTVRLCGKNYAIALGAYPNAYQEDRTMLETMVTSLDDNLGIGQTFSLQLMGTEADVEVFRVAGYFLSNGSNTYLNDAEKSYSVYTPGSAPAVICVGATTYCPSYTNYWGEQKTNVDQETGVVAYYSSRGPTFDGRTKPDVVAPGSNIVTTGNSFLYEDSSLPSTTVDISEYAGRTYPWLATLGTSFSAPMVAGCIALWLQADPTLTPDDIRTLLSETCSHPDPTLAYPNNVYGYGEIDVYRGLLRILGIDGIGEISNHQPTGVTFSLDRASILHIGFAQPTSVSAQLRVYNTAGSMLLSQQLPSGQASAEVSLAALPAGVYALQLTTSDPTVNGSTLIRITER